MDVGKVVEDKMSAEDDLYRVPDHLKVSSDSRTRTRNLTYPETENRSPDSPLVLVLNHSKLNLNMRHLRMCLLSRQKRPFQHYTNYSKEKHMKGMMPFLELLLL